MKNIFSDLISYKKDENNKTYKFLGLKFTCRNTEMIESEKKKQDEYPLDGIQSAQTLIVLFIPNKKTINGGILSIYSICEHTREICPDAQVVICTVPGKYTYAYNPYFENDEKIYRWEQIVQNMGNAKKVILHIPEYFGGKFYKALKPSERAVLKSVPDLQINILNQNIELMPPQKELDNLYKLTKNVTQTIGHDRYASPEICKKWTITPHFLSVLIECKGKYYDFSEKEKTIVLSPDKHPMRENIVSVLKKNMPEFKLVTVENLKYKDYVDLISRSFFTITFGEGFDSYFAQPLKCGSLSFAVYNNEFFPDESWKSLENIYSSYEEMEEKISQDMRRFLEESAVYNAAIKTAYEKHKSVYPNGKFLNNLKNFYNKDYKI